MNKSNSNFQSRVNISSKANPLYSNSTLTQKHVNPQNSRLRESKKLYVQGK